MWAYYSLFIHLLIDIQAVSIFFTTRTKAEMVYTCHMSYVISNF